jgi:hypothetical protein
MKRRILNFRVPAKHHLITDLADFRHLLSISDYDALLIDPQALDSGMTSDDLRRRIFEINDLLNLKGGIVICMLRQNWTLVVSGAQMDRYGIFELTAPRIVPMLRTAVRPGDGSQITPVSSAKGMLGGYFRLLSGSLRFAAYFDTADANIAAVGGIVFAHDSVRHAVAVEFDLGAGRLCFVPVPQDVSGEQVGAAIVRVVETHFGGPREIEAPAWSVDVPIPGGTAYDAKIADLEQKEQQIDTEIAQLKQKRADVLSFRMLLYGYGKSVLEPVVRSAFRLLGFTVPEPDEYAGEWDVELHQTQPTTTAIGEIEGSAGVIDVDKFRQLLDYFQAEVLEGRVHKGILIGNGYRLRDLDAPERQSQFSTHAQRGGNQNGFCLLPTTELFKAVCAVLEAPDDEGLKIRIRDSIMNGVGVWAFARESIAPASVVSSAASRP